MRASELVADRPREVFEAVLGLSRVAVAAGARDAVSPLVVELLQALRREISEPGSGGGGGGRLVGMTGMSPDEAGRVVGCTGRRVRQLCSAGLVAHQVVGRGRYVVDVEDLARYFRGERGGAA